MEWRRQRWEKGTRYYEIYLQQDLWGEWVLTQIWGQRGTAWGRIKHMPCKSYEDGLARLEAVGKRRAQHGYLIVGTTYGD